MIAIATFESALIPDKIYTEGWDFYAGTRNGAIFQKQSPTPQVMITFADGQEIYTDNDYDIEVIMSRASAEKNYYANPSSPMFKPKNDKKPSLTNEQRLFEFEEFLMDYRSMSSSPSSINTSSVYGKWDGFPEIFTKGMFTQERTTPRRWEIWYEKTGQFDITDRLRERRQSEREKKSRALKAADDFILPKPGETRGKLTAEETALGRAMIEAIRDSGFGDPNSYDATFHGTTKRNWERIQEEGIKPSGNRLSFEMMNDVIDAGMEQHVEDFANGDRDIIKRAEEVIPLFESYRFGDFYPEAIAEETVWSSDNEAAAALFALFKWENQGKSNPQNPSNFQVEEIEGDNYPIILEIESDEENGRHYVVDDSPVMETGNAEFRAFPFGVPASRLKVHRELKRFPGETTKQYDQRMSEIISGFVNDFDVFQKWVDNYNSGAYFKRRTNQKRIMRPTWRSPKPTKMIEKVVWDRWDNPQTPSNPMSKRQAQSIANNIRTKKAGGGVHLARVIPVKGGYIVYERPKNRKWRMDSSRTSPRFVGERINDPRRRMR